MQDNQLHGNLTVTEAMKVAANLKLGSHVNKVEKEEVVSWLSYPIQPQKFWSIEIQWHYSAQLFYPFALNVFVAFLQCSLVSLSVTTANMSVIKQKEIPFDHEVRCLLISRRYV